MAATTEHSKQPPGQAPQGRSVDPREVWARLQAGQARLPDLRTRVERRRYGVPPGAIPVSLAAELLRPAGRARSTCVSTPCGPS
jgi:hypothetical protein